jgi:hypothetical protein
MPASTLRRVHVPACVTGPEARRQGTGWLLSRFQADRVVIRHGKAIDTTLPDYRQLDDLVKI